MYRIAKPLFLLCESSLHAGSGSDLGIVDLPIQREKHTTFPKIESSSIKGGIREAFEKQINTKSFADLKDSDTKIHRLFGYDDGGLSPDEKEKLENVFKEGETLNKDFAGAIGFSDARLLLFPIKSMKGVFCWATCPKVLNQFKSDLEVANVDSEIPFKDLKIENDVALVCSETQLKVSKIGKVILEEYSFNVEESDHLKTFGEWISTNVFDDLTDYWKNKIKKDIILLPDDDFRDFVNLSTEVITRTKIDNVTGTVAQGALFTEEFLPAESIMYSLLLTAPEFKKEGMNQEEVLKFFAENLPSLLQLGGNASLGKGIIRTKLFNP